MTSHSQKVTKDSFVVQANSLARAPFSVEMSVHALRIIAVAMAKITSEPNLFDEVTVSYQDLKAIFPSYKQTNKVGEYMRSVVSTIGSTHMLMYSPEHGVRYANLCQDAQYLKGRGLFVIRFHSDVRGLMLNLALNGHYTRYQLESISLLRNEAEVHLFHYLRSFAFRGKASVPLASLRSRLGLGSGKYDRWVDLRKKVIEPALASINEHTEINVSMDWSGRPVKMVDFVISLKGRSVFEPVEVGVLAYLKELGVAAGVAAAVASSVPPMEIANRVAYWALTVAKSSGPRAIREPVALLTSILRSDVESDPEKLDPKLFEAERVKAMRAIRQAVFDQLDDTDKASLRASFSTGLQENYRRIFEANPSNLGGALASKWRSYLDGVVIPERASVQFVVGPAPGRPYELESRVDRAALALA